MRQLKHFVTRSVVAAMAIAAMVGLSVGTVEAAPFSGAQRAPITIQNRDCSGTVYSGAGSGSGSGFANINETATGTLIAAVVLVNAAPSTTYGVRLIQTPPESTQDCGSWLGPYEDTVVTDANGNVNVNIHEGVLPGATGAFVVLNNEATPSVDYYTSSKVVF
jgi:hypothetical protein